MHQYRGVHPKCLYYIFTSYNIGRAMSTFPKEKSCFAYLEKIISYLNLHMCV